MVGLADSLCVSCVVLSELVVCLCAINQDGMSFFVCFFLFLSLSDVRASQGLQLFLGEERREKFRFVLAGFFRPCYLDLGGRLPGVGGLHEARFPSQFGVGGSESVSISNRSAPPGKASTKNVVLVLDRSFF